MWTEFADHVSEQTTFGNAQRVLVNFANHQTNSVGSQGATAPANGYITSNPTDLAAMQQSGGSDAEYYHGSAYWAAVDNLGNADCEGGQRGYVLSHDHLDPHTHAWEADAHNPGDQGMNWSGSAHVPRGETFSRNPSNGPQLPYIPSNP
jgi:hypothetical protein